ncbi:MAG: TIGR01212 family radical SAM protein [Candidatus Melainabacteria bacterium RIFOXYA12_FULL_32_12]|nr:MAG: TIGR01212 family radical SAM protein [Candidatus Melainabacteria bacterium RIFOXYA2_FULL_32_9]OGI29233.1 MAG: TIGR01212 family radical SAM protein [Candidatus Melainabacteria bacterium RIFOXYA12_FULL_32_12]
MSLNNSSKRYNQYSQHLEKLFDCKVYKVTLDAGFSCPNRDGSISYGGCIFCDESGSFSKAHSNLLPVDKQLNTGIERLKKRFKAKKFISYFQAYTNTYGSLEHLKITYDKALQHKDVIGLSIGTRPDCIDAEKVDLISSYTDNHYVWVEYGLQSMHDKTLKFINRGHTAQDFINAVKITQNKNINICAHVIIGLPGETRKHMLETARILADTGINGVKIHLLCVLKGTRLEKMFLNNEIRLLSTEEYVDIVCDFLEILPPEVTIHRIAGNGLKEILVAPRWLPEKFKILNQIDRELERRNSFQGKIFQPINL